MWSRFAHRRTVRASAFTGRAVTGGRAVKRSGSLLPVSVVAAVVVTLSALLAAPVGAHPEGPSHHSPLPVHATAVMRAFAADAQAQSTAPAVTGGAVACSQDGQAAGYPCQNVDLLSYLPLDQIGGTRSNSAANDIWGWTDPASGKEYAIVGRVFGTSFVDISAPESPVYLGELPTHGAFGSSWRDIKVYKDHAFIVSEAMGHGMQVFDLSQLRNVTGPPVTFAETAHYNKVATSHNVAINEDTGFAYVIGAAGKNSCSGGLHMVDIRTPESPSFAGCFSADGYTHDTQCVVYTGPDATYHGREICLNSNEDTVTIVDVTNKSAPVMLSRTSYAGSAYTHQGWLTEDQQYFLVDDELDEQNFGHGTRTRVFDVSDLDNPTVTESSTFTSTSTAIDHNQYVKGNYSFQANYRSGLRILKIDTTAAPPLSQVGYFDIYPADDAAEFNGAWSNYPYFASGVVIVSGIEQGLFVLRPNVTSDGGTDAPPTVTVQSPTDGATVAGSTPVTADATDDKGVAQVTFSVDGASIGSDNDGTNGWSVSWDTTSTPNGAHNVTATATDTAGQKASHTVSVTVDNPTLHVGDLDGTSSAAKGGKWNATVAVLVESSTETAVADATVSASWSGGASGTASCTTGSGGTCSVTLANIARSSATVTFTVSGVAHPTYTYAAGANHDPEGDSDGTTIVVAKP